MVNICRSVSATRMLPQINTAASEIASDYQNFLNKSNNHDMIAKLTVLSSTLGMALYKILGSKSRKSLTYKVEKAILAVLSTYIFSKISTEFINIKLYMKMWRDVTDKWLEKVGTNDPANTIKDYNAIINERYNNMFKEFIKKEYATFFDVLKTFTVTFGIIVLILYATIRHKIKKFDILRPFQIVLVVLSFSFIASLYMSILSGVKTISTLTTDFKKANDALLSPFISRNSKLNEFGRTVKRRSRRSKRSNKRRRSRRSRRSRRN